MIDSLLLISGNDIPFIEAQLVIHQPTLKEIAMVGEQDFFTGCEFLNFSKNLLTEEDKTHLEQHTNFEILIAILKESNAVMQKNRNCVKMALALMFPNYSITFTSDAIVFTQEQETHKIDNSNFEEFKSIISKMLAIFDEKNKQEYNPSGRLAQQIADKLKKRRQKLAEIKPNESKDFIAKYISILSVGEHKDMNELLNYTLYQLFDEFKRYQLKLDYDIYIQAKMAGAKDLKEVEDWMKDIHPSNK